MSDTLDDYEERKERYRGTLLPPPFDGDDDDDEDCDCGYPVPVPVTVAPTFLACVFQAAGAAFFVVAAVYLLALLARG